MSQAARPPEAGEFGLAWPGEPTGLAGLAFWLQAGPGTTLDVPDGQLWTDCVYQRATKEGQHHGLHEFECVELLVQRMVS